MSALRVWVQFVKFGRASEFEHLPRVRVGSISKQFPELLDDSNSPLTAIMPSVTQMIELITAPSEVKTEVTAKIESGETVTIKEIQRLKKEAVNN